MACVWFEPFETQETFEIIFFSLTSSVLPRLTIGTQKVKLQKLLNDYEKVIKKRREHLAKF